MCTVDENSYLPCSADDPAFAGMLPSLRGEICHNNDCTFAVQTSHRVFLIRKTDLKIHRISRWPVFYTVLPVRVTSVTSVTTSAKDKIISASCDTCDTH